MYWTQVRYTFCAVVSSTTSPCRYAVRVVSHSRDPPVFTHSLALQRVQYAILAALMSTRFIFKFNRIPSLLLLPPLHRSDSVTCNGAIPHPFAPVMVSYGIDDAAVVWQNRNFDDEDILDGEGLFPDKCGAGHNDATGARPLLSLGLRRKGRALTYLPPRSVIAKNNLRPWHSPDSKQSQRRTSSLMLDLPLLLESNLERVGRGEEGRGGEEALGSVPMKRI